MVLISFLQPLNCSGDVILCVHHGRSCLQPQLLNGTSKFDVMGLFFVHFATAVGC